MTLNKVDLFIIYVFGILGTLIAFSIFMFAYGWATGIKVDWNIVLIISVVYALILSPILFMVNYTNSKKVLR